MSISKDFSAAGGSHLSTPKSYPIQYWETVPISILVWFRSISRKPTAHVTAFTLTIVFPSRSYREQLPPFAHAQVSFLTSWWPPILYILMSDYFSVTGMTKLRGLWFQGSHESRFSHVEDPLRMRYFFSCAWLPPPFPSSSFVLNWLIWLAFH